MEKSEIFAITVAIVGMLWGIISSFTSRYVKRQEDDVKILAEKHALLYEALISTQQKNTESSNRLSIAIDRLTQTVASMEDQASERHLAISGRINDLHESEELLRKRIHWVINKMTLIKFALEKLGFEFKGGDWESP